MAWAALAAVIAVPLGFAATSPLLAWREPIYIIAGFAGVVGLAFMLLQPLLASGLLPGLRGFAGRRVHRLMGPVLIAAVLVHLIGLWITSPPDVIDALTFTSPTPFAPWGVVALIAILAAAGVAIFRHRLRLRVWRLAHTSLVSVAVVGTVVHAVLIQGTMEPISKAVLSLCALAALIVALRVVRPWRRAR